jgi:methyltransferase (TIGR00027 family)
MTSVEPSGVWATAVGVARVRAMESRRENALFHDPLAAAFAVAGGLSVQAPPVPEPRADGPEPGPHPEPGEEPDAERRRRWRGVALSIVIRTRFLDELLAEAVAAGCRQVVLLGAGMDSRAFRLDWPPQTRLFEVDTAEPLAFKQSVLDAEGAVPRCERIPVAVDLRDDWPGALAASGHDPAAATVWIAEGLLIYLPQDAVERLLGQVGELSAPGSRMGLTLGAPGTLKRFSEDRDSPAAMWLSVMPEDPVAWLSGLGWEARTFSILERAAAYGRPVGPGGLVSAVRRS